MLKEKVKTNIHYVVGNNSIDEAIKRLENNDFPKGINAVIFLLHKPAGLGSKKNVLSVFDEKIEKLFKLIEKPHPFKVGMDSCNVPGAINFCRNIRMEALDTCEGGRYSCYIGADMMMVPCSFDQNNLYSVSIENKTIEEAWNSEEFEKFRDKLRYSCKGCKKRMYCMGGCPLMPEVVLCKDRKKYLEEE